MKKTMRFKVYPLHIEPHRNSARDRVLSSVCTVSSLAEALQNSFPELPVYVTEGNSEFLVLETPDDGRYAHALTQNIARTMHCHFELMQGIEDTHSEARDSVQASPPQFSRMLLGS